MWITQESFPKAKYIEVVKADRSGNLSRVNARMIGEASVSLGAGRAVKGDPVDHAVGFIIHHKVGDHIDEGEPAIHHLCKRRNEADQCPGKPPCSIWVE